MVNLIFFNISNACKIAAVCHKYALYILVISKFVTVKTVLFGTYKFDIF